MDKLCRVTRQKWHIGTWPMMDLWRQQSPRAFILPILLFESRIHTHNSHHLEFVCKTDISWSTSHLQFQSWYIKEESQAFGDFLRTILIFSRCSQQLPSLVPTVRFHFSILSCCSQQLPSLILFFSRCFSSSDSSTSRFVEFFRGKLVKSTHQSFPWV